MGAVVGGRWAEVGGSRKLTWETRYRDLYPLCLPGLDLDVVVTTSLALPLPLHFVCLFVPVIFP